MTHGVRFLPEVQQVVVLKDGEVCETGTFNELLQNQGAFAEFINTYLTEATEKDEGK